MAKRRTRKKAPPPPEFAVTAGKDGFPTVSFETETSLGKQGDFETVCVYCYSTSGRISIDRHGRHYTHCVTCGTRSFFYTPQGRKVLRAHHRLLQDPEARERMMTFLATQMT